MVSIYFRNRTERITVIDKDELSWCSDLGKVFLRQREEVRTPRCDSQRKVTDIVKPKVLAIARFVVPVVRGDCEFMSRLDGDLKEA